MRRTPSRIRVPEPLQAFAVGFSAELGELGYTPNSARLQMRLMAHLSRWLVSERLGVSALGMSEVERFLRSRRATGYTAHRTEKAMRPMLAYLRRAGVVPDPPAASPNGPLEELLERYRHYLTVERGLGGLTTRGYVDAVRPFLRARVPSDGLGPDLAQIRATDIRAFVLARCSARSRGAAQSTATALRSFLGFLHAEGVLARPMAGVVPSIARWRLAGLPKGLEPEAVAGLLASCDRRTQQGRRDLAILTLLVRLGLRAGEVAALRLEDVDWRAGTFIVRGKGNRTEPLPMPADAGDAVTAYLRRGRPASAGDRTVFIRLKAPHRALSAGGVSQVVAAAARRAGLGPIRAHRLRHTAATQLLRAGAPLTEVGQLLRHRRALTTAIYAKVDRDALRTIARPWPGGAA